MEAQTLVKTPLTDFDEFVRQAFQKQWATAQPPASTWQNLQQQIKSQAKKGRRSHLLRGARRMRGNHKK